MHVARAVTFATLAVAIALPGAAAAGGAASDDALVRAAAKTRAAQAASFRLSALVQWPSGQVKMKTSGVVADGGKRAALRVDATGDGGNVQARIVTSGGTVYYRGPDIADSLPA